MTHYTTKHLFASLGLTLTLIIAVTAQKYGRPKPCNFAVRCSDVEDVVWSTDSKKCFVWRNACYLLNENCQRRNRFEEELTIIERTDCQKLCNTKCTREFKPVCAEYNGNNRTFPTNCALDAHICSTGETYSFIRAGECVPRNLITA